MTETAAPLIVPPTPSLEAVLRRCALPFFLFALMLTALLALSAFFLLPLFTRVDVGGVALTASDVRAYQLQLAASVTEQEAERDRAVLPFDDPVYEALLAERTALPSFASLRAEILRAASSLVPEKDAIAIRSFALDSAAGTLRLRGDVRNVGPRSMTVLAQFAEEIGRLPFVASVRQPLFQRLDEPGIGIHSPFDIFLTLR